MKTNLNLKFSVIVFFVSLQILGGQTPGSLDLSFDVDGKKTLSFDPTSYDYAYDVIQQPDHKIIVAGSSLMGGGLVLWRLNIDGSPDSTFHFDGLTNAGFINGYASGQSVSMQTDGKIVVGGYAHNGSFYDYAVARFHPNGTLDSSFSSDGLVTTSINWRDDYGNSVIVQPDGKIVLSGYYDNGNASLNYDIAIVRYNTDGTLDSTFDGDGIVITPIGNIGYIGQKLLLQPDGKLVLIGSNIASGSSQFLVFRYNSNGSLDYSFDTDGKVFTNISTFTDIANDGFLQPNGKIVAVGWTTNASSNSNFALTRYKANGTLDSTFDSDGIVISNLGSYYDVGYSGALQWDGKIVAAGHMAPLANFAVSRYQSNGTIDPSFNGTGLVQTDFFTNADKAYRVKIQHDGKILVVGYTDNGTNDDLAIARYHSGLVCTNTSDTISPQTCQNYYISPSGSYSWSAPGIYLDTIANYHGCDSIITVNLTFNSSSNGSLNTTQCYQYSSPSGNYIWNSSGTYLDTIPNLFGCDSIITIHLSINSSSSDTINPTSCFEYISPSGNYVWNVSGTYADTIQTALGCDSTLIINLIVNQPDVSTNQIGNNLTSNQVGASYQWIDCNNSNQPIVGATGQSYLATNNGDYAVIVTANGCTDTSSCLNVVGLGITELLNSKFPIIYPNPTKGLLTIHPNIVKSITQISVVSITGNLVHKMSYDEFIGGFIDLTHLATGLYIIEMVHKDFEVIRTRIQKL